MSLTQKLFALQAQIDELKLRMRRIESGEYWPGGDALEARDVQYMKAIEAILPIVCATVAPPPKKRGRPPKA